jgi:hypothetical protein
MGKLLAETIAARRSDGLYSTAENCSAGATELNSPSAAVAFDPVKAEADSSSLYGWETLKEDINDIFGDPGLPLTAPNAAGNCSATADSSLIKSESAADVARMPLTSQLRTRGFSPSQATATDVRTDSPTVTGTISAPDPKVRIESVPLDMDALNDKRKFNKSFDMEITRPFFDAVAAAKSAA